ncbi:MAG TPA: hypothetical protein VE172_04500 [Stackebrandtia sp.]|jgi:hypothetical protein|uniref:hypothetical protein n=1 Tax=Stackebrandtia sp. TaxID=2023065 RepID=UPI002D4EE8D2|nr:hypothetical protein [Stackebrandtia sp.]HZE38053.1 hypothetical protein [Stackebrandtia sp.]
MSSRISTRDDKKRRAVYLTEMSRLLYGPGPGGERATTAYIAIPNLRTPRLLVPGYSRRLAAAALRRYARPASRAARLKRDAAVAALWCRLDRFMLPDRVTLDASGDNVAGYLRRSLGQEVHLSIHIGPARANRKPVIQILDSGADTVGFAKLGTNELTRQLVSAETAALRTLEGVRLLHVRVPRVRHSGTWGELQVLVQEALPGWRRPMPVQNSRLYRAMRELSGCLGTQDVALADSDYASTLEARMKVLADRDCPDCSTLVDAGVKLLDRHGDQRLTFGSWHGDWAPWNMSMLPEGLMLWDFERFATGVPQGFDALHYTLQRDIVTREIDPTTAVLTLLSEAPRLLEPFEVRPSAARATALLYLVDLAARYLTDRQAEAGAALGALGRWLLPTLLRHVAAEGVVLQ